jgi:RNA polymerase sigma-70 factor (ECF subfamily)
VNNNWPPDAELERIINEYGNSLLKLGFLYLGDVQLAQDALQDTLLKTAASLSRFKGESSEKTWITRIMINTCKNYRRTNWMKRVTLSEALNEIPAEQTAKSNDGLIEAVMALPAKYREVILLYYYQEMQTREIAKVIHRAESTVSVRLMRARKMLKADLSDEYCALIVEPDANGSKLRTKTGPSGKQSDAPSAHILI